MKDGSWLETLLVIVVAWIAYDCLRRHGAGASGRWLTASRWNNLQIPKDSPVTAGLVPNSTGTVPTLDGSRKGCGCS
jgi:hypothetical protein